MADNPPTTPDAEARELLACALTDNGQLATANAIRSKQFGFDYGIPPIVALRAIQAALTQSATAADRAYEDAARVAEDFYDDDAHDSYLEASSDIAAAIRQRKSGAGDGESLRAAAIALRDDMLMRAKMNAWQEDGEIVVEAGNGVWSRFCRALDPAPPREGEL